MDPQWPFKLRFFGKQDLSSSFSSSFALACDLLLPTFALPLFLLLPPLGRRASLFGRPHPFRPVLGDQLSDREVFSLQQSGQEDEPSPLCTAQAPSRWLARGVCHALACEMLLGKQLRARLRQLALSLRASAHHPNQCHRHGQPKPLNAPGVLHFLMMPAKTSPFDIGSRHIRPKLAAPTRRHWPDLAQDR